MKPTNGHISTNELLNRLPPEADDMEQRTIGSLLLDGTNVQRCNLLASDFRVMANGIIWSAMLDLARDGLDVNVDTVVHRLRERCQLEAVGGPEYIAVVLNSVGVPQHYHTYARIVKDRAVRRRILRGAEEIIQAAHDLAAPVSLALGRMRDIADRETRQVATPGSGSISMAELCDNHAEPTWIVKNMLVENEPAAIGAARKGLKTSIASDLGISAAAGLPFLGVFPVTAARNVLYMSGECSRPFLFNLWSRICQFKGIDLRDVGGFRLAKKFLRLDSPVHLAEMRQEWEAGEVALFFYDCLYLGLSGDNAGNCFSQGEKFQAFGEMCEQCGVTPVILHHTTRRQERDGAGKAPELSDLSWAGLAEYTAQWLMLGRSEPYDPATPGSHRLVMEIGGRQGQSGSWAVDIEEGDLEHGRRWDVYVQTTAEARTARQDAAEQARESKQRERAERDLEDARKAIVAAMAKLGRPADRSEIEPRAAIRKTRFATAWASLVDDGSVVQSGTIQKGNSRSYPTYQLGGCDED